MAQQRKTWFWTALAIMQVFNGLSALAGGFGLMSDPSGEALEMKTAWLEGTPFSSFLFPGIILFVVNGLGNTAGAVITFRRNRLSTKVGMAFGIFMIGWIISQVLFIGYMSFLQPLYFVTGLVQFAFGYFLQKSIVQHIG